MKQTLDIRITGIVQGVGFRPFIYRLAHKHGITGSVLNDTGGVLIHAEGESSAINRFIAGIESERPSQSVIDDIIINESIYRRSIDFVIEKSAASSEKSAFLPPDFALCEECEKEFFSPLDRRYNYPFITCINCGPRFSIASDIPYDRVNTSMDEFKMCAGCGDEYNDPMDRRFHAQPIACPECGPRLSLYDKNKNLILERDSKKIGSMTADLLGKGFIFAIKGVGGYHLAADARDDNAVLRLRDLKGRPFKPFALMAGSIDAIKSFLHVSDMEEELLLSRERPIVLMKMKEPKVSSHVAPGLTFMGAMLPYTPFQHLLFSIDRNMILIMTSGNISEEPIAYIDDDAFDRLNKIADYFVAYDREILAHSDDSVLFVEMGGPYFIRRSRGYVPLPMRSKKTGGELIAMGGDMKNSFAISRKDIIILSQYLGDLATPQGYALFDKVFGHYRKVYGFNPDAVIADMHPGYYTGRIAGELEKKGLRRFDVQHHHAHIASVMEENGLDERIIGIAFDGTGYGTDGTLWGSEFLICGRGDFIRAGHFTNFSLPGGESAVHDVWRIGVSLLHSVYGRDIPLFDRDDKTCLLMDMIEKKINSPQTCSIGRMFDGISSILGISRTISSEAEAAIKLEEAAIHASSRKIGSFKAGWVKKEAYEIDTSSIVRYIVELLQKGTPVDEAAFMFHMAVINTAIAMSAALREEYSIDKIALSGGVFQNRLILSAITGKLKERKFQVYTNRFSPCNDGCIALGQIAVGKEVI